MLRRERAGVDAVDERPGRGDRVEELLEPRGVRGEAAVEAHGQERPAALDGLGELARVGHRHRHRLLDEHRLARLDRRAGDRVVEVVAGGHVDDGDRGVVEDLAVVRRSPGEAVVLDGGADGEPAAGAGRGQREAGVRLQQRQQHRAEVPAVADHPDAERAVLRRRRGAADRAVRDRARRRRPPHPGGSRAGCRSAGSPTRARRTPRPRSRPGGSRRRAASRGESPPRPGAAPPRGCGPRSSARSRTGSRGPSPRRPAS